MKVKQKVGVKQKLGSTMEESEEKKYWFERWNSFLEKDLFAMGLKSQLNFNYHMEIWEEGGNTKRQAECLL